MSDNTRQQYNEWLEQGRALRAQIEAQRDAEVLAIEQSRIRVLELNAELKDWDARLGVTRDEPANGQQAPIVDNARNADEMLTLWADSPDVVLRHEGQELQRYVPRHIRDRQVQDNVEVTHYRPHRRANGAHDKAPNETTKQFLTAPLAEIASITKASKVAQPQKQTLTQRREAGVPTNCNDLILAVLAELGVAKSADIFAKALKIDPTRREKAVQVALSKMKQDGLIDAVPIDSARPHIGFMYSLKSGMVTQ